MKLLTNFFWGYQIVEAKVHQLDFSLERIFLSLKEITVRKRSINVSLVEISISFDIYPFDIFMQPDPLTEALESVVGDDDQLGRLQAAELDAEVL